MKYFHILALLMLFNLGIGTAYAQGCEDLPCPPGWACDNHDGGHCYRTGSTKRQKLGDPCDACTSQGLCCDESNGNCHSCTSSR